MIKKIYKSVRNALFGLSYAYSSDKSFRMEAGGSLVYIILGYILWPLSGVELALFIGSYLLILITELINTSIEQMLERLHPERHHLIGASKDIASAAVLMAFVFAIMVVSLLILDRLGLVFFS